MTDPNNSRCSDSCCGGTSALASDHADAVPAHVREGYSNIARGASGGGCCGPATFTPDELAQAIGYSQQDLAATPDAANIGLSCGNPTALTSLQPGDVVLNLGAGGGFDCFVAGPKVGACGDNNCRTMIVDGRTYEAIPPELIVRAGLHGVADRIKPTGPAKSCCTSGDAPAESEVLKLPPRPWLSQDGD